MKIAKVLIWIGVVLITILSAYIWYNDVVIVKPLKSNLLSIQGEDDISLQAKRYQIMYDMVADIDQLNSMDAIINYCNDMSNVKFYKTKITSQIPKKTRQEVLKCWQDNFPNVNIIRPSELVSDKNPQPSVPKLSTEEALRYQIMHDISKIELNKMNDYLENVKNIQINLQNPYYLENKNSVILNISKLERSCGDLKYLF